MRIWCLGELCIFFLCVLIFPCHALNKPPVYWINLDIDVHRRELMQQHLRFMNFSYHQRIPALTPKNANILLLEHECRRYSLVDIAILCSHLSAVHAAVNDIQAADSDYALILEDDIRFEFDIDFEQLIASAPKNFGVLQLMTSHFDQIVPHWKNYKIRQELWSFRPPESSVWSAQAYIINKRKYKPYVDAAVGKSADGSLTFKIIQTFEIEKSERLLHNSFKPTVLSVCIFADMFIYSVGRPAFILNLPLLNSAGVGMNSTSHQTHVAHHAKGYAFHQHSQKEMVSGLVPLPKFAILLSNRSEAALDWALISANNPIKHWAQGSYKIADTSSIG